MPRASRKPLCPGLCHITRSRPSPSCTGMSPVLQLSPAGDGDRPASPMRPASPLRQGSRRLGPPPLRFPEGYGDYYRYSQELVTRAQWLNSSQFLILSSNLFSFFAHDKGRCKLPQRSSVTFATFQLKIPWIRCGAAEWPGSFLLIAIFHRLVQRGKLPRRRRIVENYFAMTMDKGRWMGFGPGAGPWGDGAFELLVRAGFAVTAGPRCKPFTGRRCPMSARLRPVCGASEFLSAPEELR